MREYAYVYEKGKRRSNQDSILIEKMSVRGEELVMACVCDGMGGMDHGEIASGYIVEQCGIWFFEKLPELIKHFGTYAVEQSFRENCYHMHNSLKDYGAQKSMHLGSTLSLFLSVGKDAIIFHYGDSAIFKIYPNAKRLTKEHTNEGELNRCLGLGKYYPPDIKKLHLRFGDCYLLCSDGLLHHFSEKEMKDIMQNGKHSKRRLETIVNAAYRRGEEDNISAIFLRV